MKLTRADRSLLSDWWFTVDRLFVSAILLLMLSGVVLSLAASPSVADRLGLDTFHFFRRHAVAVLPAFIIFISASLLTPRLIRRVSLILLGVSLALLVATLFVSTEIKGAARWLQFAGFSLQPSEFVKPAFVVVSAWLFSEAQHRDDVPGLTFAIMLFAIFVGLLVMQPDFGQAFLVTLVWGGLFFLAGMPFLLVGALAIALLMGVMIAYLTVPHVAGRIDRFINPEAGDTYQTDRALEAFRSGGWVGAGPGEGTVKQSLPDAHADFIFAVIAEEFGLIACLVLVAVFAFVVMRAMVRVHDEGDVFIRMATIGLVTLFGLQALINMGVNVGLLPAKGMTLPFISYGGSSLLAMALTMGFVAGLTRWRPRTSRMAERERRSAQTSNPKEAGT